MPGPCTESRPVIFAGMLAGINMIDIDEIRKIEENILKLSKELLTLRPGRKMTKINAKIKQLEFDQETAIMNILEKDDEQYIKKLNENFDLLINDNIEFVVTQEIGNPLSSYAKELYGEIHNNGFLYFSTQKTNFLYASFQSGFYPLSYIGLINYLGETNVMIDKKGFKLIGSRVPQRYKGSIDAEGNVNFKTTESYWESGGYYFVNHIIADPFSGNSGKRSKFIENRIELKNMIKTFRGNINNR